MSFSSTNERQHRNIYNLLAEYTVIVQFVFLISIDFLLGITYWCGNFLWDLFNYCLSISFCLIIFVSFNIEAYVSSMNLLCLILLLFLYGFAIIPLMYPINYIFQIPSTGFVLISCINIFIGLITTISTYLLESFDDQPDLERIGDILKKVFLIFPHYCLGRGLFDMSRIYATNMINSKYSLFVNHLVKSRNFAF